METTEFFNDKLPDANIKGDGIGDKYTNMLNDFGKIKDESAVENIERGGEDIKEEYTSQYSDAEVAAMDPNSKQAQESLERLKQLQEQMRQQQEQDNHLPMTERVETPQRKTRHWRDFARHLLKRGWKVNARLLVHCLPLRIVQPK